MVMRKWFVLAVYQLWKSISAGPALKGGPEPLEKEIHEILGFETWGSIFQPFFWTGTKNVSGSFSVPAPAG